MNILVFNPGSNSLKAELVCCKPRQRHAFDGTKLLSASVEGIGKNPVLSRLEKKKAVSSEPIAAGDYAQATENFLQWYQEHARRDLPALGEIDAVEQLDCNLLKKLLFMLVIYGGGGGSRTRVRNRWQQREAPCSVVFRWFRFARSEPTRCAHR
jgi:hypothetical protein